MGEPPGYTGGSDALSSNTTGVGEPPGSTAGLTSEITGMDDSSAASEPQQPTEEEKFAEAVASGQANAMRSNTV